MKKRLALILFAVGAISFFAFRQAAESRRSPSVNEKTGAPSELKPQVFRAAAFAVSGKVRDFAPAAPGDGATSRKMGRAEAQARKIPNNEIYRKLKPDAARDVDAARAEFSYESLMPAPALSFDGLSNADNAAAYGFRVAPPDANGDVGPDHFVQAVNVLTRVYDKTGAPLTPPFKLSSIFSALGTPCSRRNDGDPIVLYDALADRWLFSQFCNNAPPFRQLVAVSKTADPTGEFYVYEFVMPNIKFNDYPKFGVWTNAYYMATDEFVGSEYAGSGAFAFDKKKLLAGDPTAGFVYFDLATPSTVRFGGFLPGDLDGINAPPDGAPNVFVGYQATEYGDRSDAVRLFDFHADFAIPERSTFAERAESPLPVAAFDPTSPDGRDDIGQPAPGDRLDAQSDRLMYRAAYRNFGAFESIVVNQTVRVSPLDETYRAGVRVYELRKSAGAPFAVHEQATVGTPDESRWLGSAAQDHRGNLAVGYSRASETEKPAIVYTGKTASDAPGAFRREAALIEGTGVQTGFGARWGDYSQLTVDPGDDCTFWLTNEYYSAASQAENPFGWLTRVGKFKFDECATAPRAVIRGAVVSAANDQPIAGATVTANRVYTRASAANTGVYGDFRLLPGVYDLTATARGFRPQTVRATVADGQVAIENFALQPIAVFETATVNIAAESCAANNAAEPSETVTANVTFTNAGAARAANLTVALLPTGGVTDPTAPQDFGAIESGASAARSFGFTVASNLRCGEAVVLSFELKDGAENLGVVTAQLRAGAPRTAFAENFDQTAEPNLPAGWTTAATGAPTVWKTAVALSSSTRAAYSFAAAQPGANELVAPPVRINSATAVLKFHLRYDFETTFLRNKLYDGAVLEIKIGAGEYQDILAAGGTFTTGGYDGVLESCCQNPLGGRRAWSGKSGPNETPQFIASEIKLPAAARGTEIRLRWRVGTDNGTAREGIYIDDIEISDGFDCACGTVAPNRRAPFDFDGDGASDLSVFRRTTAAEAADFYVENSSDNALVTTAWGAVGDQPAVADYDADGRADYAVFRPANGIWFVLRSADNTVFPVAFGAASDRIVPADYDADGRADIAVFRPSGNAFWYVRRSSDGGMRAVQFGQAGDVPVPADFDGDGSTDFAVFRPSNGVWYVRRSSDGGLTSARFGQAGDAPVAGDFDGDGLGDAVVFRPATGVWYQRKTRDGFAARQFGAAGDRALRADFDGDGKLDVAVFRPSTGVWHYIKSSNAAYEARRFGAGATDAPLPAIDAP